MGTQIDFDELMTPRDIGGNVAPAPPSSPHPDDRPAAGGGERGVGGRRSTMKAVQNWMASMFGAQADEVAVGAKPPAPPPTASMRGGLVAESKPLPKSSLATEKLTAVKPLTTESV